MRFQIEVNTKKCIACTKCYTLDKEHFESGAEGKARVRGGAINRYSVSVGNFSDGKLIIVHEAEFSCPVSAIKVIWESELMPSYPTI